MFRIILLVGLIFNDFIALYVEGVDESTIIEPAIAFSDVTEEAGITFRHFDGRQGDRYFVETIGSGCAFLDYNNDGYLDLYLVSANNFPQSSDEDNSYCNQLYQNTGSGSFVLVAAGVEDQGYGTGAAVADYDGDGWLDLYLTNFGSNRLFRNQGDGTFQDLTQQAGLHNPIGKGMSAIWSDYDNDGDPDLFVANDGTENFLYQNNNDGTFQDLAWLAGVDCDDHGNMQGSMGLDLADYDNDGYPDLLVTNFQRQLNTLYRNEGNGFFNDISFPSGLGYSLPFVSWGTGFFDFNNDGFLDLFIVNGHIQDQIERYDSSTTYLQADHLLLNDQQNSFDRQPPLLTPPKAGRGAAFGDYDNDGDIDILVNNAHDVPTLWRNDTKSMHHWLMVKLVGQNGNRYGIGAKTKIITPAQTWSAECRAGASYMSTNDSRLHFGLGQTRSIEQVEVHWPSGLIDRIKSPLINSILVVVEGSTQE